MTLSSLLIILEVHESRRSSHGSNLGNRTGLIISYINPVYNSDYYIVSKEGISVFKVRMNNVYFLKKKKPHTIR